MLREDVARAIAKGLDGWNDFDAASEDYRNELLNGADSVLELWNDRLEEIISELEKEKPSLRQIPDRIRYHGKA